MKKEFCLALAALFIMGMMVSGLAEAVVTLAPDAAPNEETVEPSALEEGVTDASQADASDPAASLDAAVPEADHTVDIDGQFTFVCPGALIPQDVNQKDMDDGLLFSAFNDTMGVDVYKYPQQEGDTLDTLYEGYKTDGSMSEVTLASVGTVRVLVFRIDETGINATLAGDSGSMYDIMFTYQSPEEYQQVGKMIASLKKAGA